MLIYPVFLIIFSELINVLYQSTDVMQPRVSLNQFSFHLCALPPCHAIPTASQSCLVKAAVEQAPCWGCSPAASGPANTPLFTC